MHRKILVCHVYLLMKQVKDFQFPLAVSHLCNQIRNARTYYPKPACESKDLPCSTTTIAASTSSSKAYISHPWPEWVSLMEMLLREGYFEGNGDPFQNGVLGPRESNSIRTACLNFARDRCQVMGSLSSKHIRIVVECGCPSTDRKVVNSGKRLRAYLGLDEGNVCSFCNLRGNCERAFVEAQGVEQGIIIDVMRIMLTYGFDPIFSNVENKPCLNIRVQESVRHLLKQMVEYSSGSPVSHLSKPSSSKDLSVHPNLHGKDHTDNPLKPGDWHCLKCNFMNFSRNIKCLCCDTVNEEKLRQIQEEQENLPLKKGDWICDKCTILNFAKNTRCWKCEAKPPRRKLNPGEWECESCNYINFRRNAICLNCDHRRPKALNVSKFSVQPEDGKEGRHAVVTNVVSPSSLRRQGQYGGLKEWRFVDVDEETEVHEQLKDGASRFMDFPIARGKSDLSRDIRKKEDWKLKVVESKGRAVGRQRESMDGLQSCGSLTKMQTPQCAFEEEDVAGWFGVSNTP